MPDEEAVKPMVDIDSSGPGADIEVEDSVQPETEIEETPTEKIQKNRSHPSRIELLDRRRCSLGSKSNE